MPELQISPRLTPFSTRKKRYKIAIGGRGSGKSQTFADLCLRDVQTHGLKVGCFREFQNSIEDSVHSLLKDEIDRLELQGFKPASQSITHGNGGEFKFRGLARNPSAIKSMHGFKRFWVEEAQTISEESLKLLTPTLRESDSEIWMSANPMASVDPFSERFINPFLRDIDRNGYYEDDLHLIVVVNYKENPFFPQVLEDERAFDEKHLPLAQYEHIWLGKYLDTVEGAIIPVQWFNAAIDAHERLGIEPRGARIVTHDPSDEGPDNKSLIMRHGSVVLHAEEKEDGDISDGADWATAYAIAERADVFRWDCDGMGVGIKRDVVTALDGTGVDIQMFKGSETPDEPDRIYQPDPRIDRRLQRSNKDTFRNKRAQYYWALRNRFHATYQAITKGVYIDPEQMISLSSEIDCMNQLKTEVCRIPQKYNVNGLIQIMTKEDMAKLKPPIPSPNLADSLMMSMPIHQRNAAVRSSSRRPVKRTRKASGWT